jgi:hypothetical protein
MTETVIPTEELGALLLSFCDKTHFRKVARIASHLDLALREQGIQFSEVIADAFDARMAALVNGGQLEAKGNIKRWRFSEVRRAD